MVGYGAGFTFQELKIGNILMKENILPKPNKKRHCLAIQALLGNQTIHLLHKSVTHSLQSCLVSLVFI